MDRTTIKDPGEVDLGTTHVRVRLPHERAWRSAAILEQTTSQGTTVLVLDRVVHRWNCTAIGGWQASGALTTELRREVA